MMQIGHSVRATLTLLQNVLSQLSIEEYARPLEVLSNSSIGQHTRHIIEFFQALTNSYESGVVNYDKRERNTLIETSRDLALLELAAILDSIFVNDKQVLLVGSYSSEGDCEFAVESTYYREIVYNLEHTIHHMAMIKIGIRNSTNVTVSPDFGVAASTIQYKKAVL